MQSVVEGGGGRKILGVNYHLKGDEGNRYRLPDHARKSHGRGQKGVKLKPESNDSDGLQQRKPTVCSQVTKREGVGDKENH